MTESPPDYTLAVAIGIGVLLLFGVTFTLVRKLSRDAELASSPVEQPRIDAPSQVQKPAAPPPATADFEPVEKLGGKRVVLEYDLQPANPASPQAPAEPIVGANPEIIALAREAYHRGNLRLVAGDPRGAEKHYREALRIYPGYVAGYRGLGESYSEKGDRKNALKAFKLYVKTVPAAIDAPLIRKRIEKLERK